MAKDEEMFNQTYQPPSSGSRGVDAKLILDLTEDRSGSREWLRKWAKASEDHDAALVVIEQMKEDAATDREAAAKQLTDADAQSGAIRDEARADASKTRTATKEDARDLRASANTVLAEAEDKFAALLVREAIIKEREAELESLVFEAEAARDDAEAERAEAQAKKAVADARLQRIRDAAKDVAG